MNKLCLIFICCLCVACGGESGGSGSVFNAVNVVQSVTTSEIRYVGGNIDVDVDVFGPANVDSVQVWLTDPSATVTSLGAATKNGDTHSFNYSVPTNTNLDGTSEPYELRLLVLDADGNTLRDIDVDVSVPAMLVPPDAPSFP